VVKALATALACAVAGAAAAAPPCETRVAVEPGTAWVGEQVVYRLTILRQRDVSDVRLTDELSFPSFRVEWLPGQTLDPAIGDVGGHALVVEERRALFPVRAGTLAIPATRIECRTAAGTTEVAVPGASLEVRALPGDRAEVVGPVAIGAQLASERVELGRAVRLTVTLRGEGNVWDAPPPLGAIDGIDAHPVAPELSRTAGPRVELTEVFAWDLVPRTAGPYEVPPLRVAWLDPATGRFEESATAALHLDVAPPTVAAERAPTPTPRAAPPPAPSIGAHGLGVALASVAIGAAAAAAWRNRRRTTPARAAAPHLEAATAAAARGDRTAERDALAAALRAGLAVRRTGAPALAAEELAAAADGAERDAAEALLALDRARFAAGAGSPAPDAARVRALVAALGSRSRDRE
jgi:hypothetical protein